MNDDMVEVQMGKVEQLLTEAIVQLTKRRFVLAMEAMDEAYLLIQEIHNGVR